jgi:hypothetical protein
MKDALQTQHEEEGNTVEVTYGPDGKPVVNPEVTARKLARDKKVSEEVSAEAEGRSVASASGAVRGCADAP